LSDSTHEKDSQLLRERGLGFLGGQTAAQCHEVTNVFNTINEMVGLMGDLLWEAQDKGRPLDPERLAELTGRVATQIQRGSEIVRAINRFGHSADTPRAVFDLQTILAQIAFMSRRPAASSETTLETDFPDQSLSLENSPLGFQQAIFTALEIALSASGEKRRITLGYTLTDSGARIDVVSDDALTDRHTLAEQGPFLRLLVQSLGGRVERLMEPEAPHRITLLFPR